MLVCARNLLHNIQSASPSWLRARWLVYQSPNNGHYVNTYIIYTYIISYYVSISSNEVYTVARYYKYNIYVYTIHLGM